MYNANDAVDDEAEVSPAPRASRLVVWLIIVSLGALFLPLYLVSTSIKQENAQFEVTLTAIQATLAYTPLPPESETALQETLLQVRGQINALEPVSADLAAAHLDWLNALAVISRYDRERINLSGITQTENRLVLNGLAANESDVLAYFHVLDDAELFNRVIVQSITLKDAPTPNQPTAKPVVRDAAATETPAERVAEFSILVELKVGVE
ncbi:MAG: PilN domain-containing protein [Anaerolineae bacterium]|nr:PilN domain-containing protein [Anaerolineae bacterium]